MMLNAYKPPADVDGSESREVFHGRVASVLLEGIWFLAFVFVNYQAGFYLQHAEFAGSLGLAFGACGLFAGVVLRALMQIFFRSTALAWAGLLAPIFLSAFWFLLGFYSNEGKPLVEAIVIAFAFGTVSTVIYPLLSKRVGRIFE